MKAPHGFVIVSVICLVALWDQWPVEGDSANASGTNVRTFAVSGRIRELKPDGKTVVIQHEAIPDYMDAMTMPFHARATNDLAGVQPGDTVTFRLSVTDSESWIDQVRKTGRTNAPISAASSMIVMGNQPVKPQAEVRGILPLPLGYVFSVAQISNLLYRRIPFGRPPDHSQAQEVSKAGGLEIRDTADWKSALRSVGTHALNRYPLGGGEGRGALPLN